MGYRLLFHTPLAVLVHELEHLKLKIVEIGNILPLVASGDLT